MAPPQPALRHKGAVMAAERERRFYRELPKVVSSSGRRLRARPREGPEPCLSAGRRAGGWHGADGFCPTDLINGPSEGIELHPR